VVHYRVKVILSSYGWWNLKCNILGYIFILNQQLIASVSTSNSTFSLQSLMQMKWNLVNMLLVWYLTLSSFHFEILHGCWVKNFFIYCNIKKTPQKPLVWWKCCIMGMNIIWTSELFGCQVMTKLHEDF
jgi:hypothetical protein